MFCGLAKISSRHSNCGTRKRAKLPQRSQESCAVVAMWASVFLLKYQSRWRSLSKHCVGCRFDGIRLQALLISHALSQIFHQVLDLASRNVRGRVCSGSGNPHRVNSRHHKSMTVSPSYIARPSGSGGSDLTGIISLCVAIVGSYFEKSLVRAARHCPTVSNPVPTWV